MSAAKKRMHRNVIAVALANKPARITGSRVNFFMNKFRRLGLIDCNGRIEVRKALLNFVRDELPHSEA